MIITPLIQVSRDEFAAYIRKWEKELNLQDVPICGTKIFVMQYVSENVVIAQAVYRPAIETQYQIREEA